MSRNPTGKKSRILASAIGGPSTERGINYQLDYGILRTLDAIIEVMINPLQHIAITMEPRSIESGRVTSWDICTSNTMIEVKLSPTKHDIIEWLERVQECKALSVKLSIVHSKTTAASLLHGVRRLAGLAQESNSDKDRFNALVSMEAVKEADLILRSLGSDYFEQLLRITIESIPEDHLVPDLEFRAKCLAGAKGKSLIDLLFRKFAQAGPKRQTYEINTLIAEARKDGITFHVPPDVTPSDLPSEIASALFLLQNVPTGLPLEVIGWTVGNSEAEQFTKALSPFVDKEIVITDGNCLRIAQLPNTIPVQNGDLILAEGLRLLLRFIERNDDKRESRQQLRNVIELSRRCKQPEVLVEVFGAIHKILKTTGDKHAVLEMADVSIRASRELPGDQTSARARALALICGKSWVYQRIFGRLEDSKIWARKSLTLGQDIGWQRNTAFCLKCIGRIFRLEAETAKNETEKMDFLSQSMNHLKSAISLFENSMEFGPVHPEVGDCYSLIGRTYLVSADLIQATENVRRAFELVPKRGSKDYLDLLILAGDIQEAMGNRSDADGFYAEALQMLVEDDFEISEILARAYFQRARNQQKMARKDLAKKNYEKAAENWNTLGEIDLAAKAQWFALTLSSELSSQTLSVLDKEPRYLTRMQTVHMLQQQPRSHSDAKVVANRLQPSIEQINRILAEARKQVAMEDRDW